MIETRVVKVNEDRYLETSIDKPESLEAYKEKYNEEITLKLANQALADKYFTRCRNLLNKKERNGEFTYTPTEIAEMLDNYEPTFGKPKKTLKDKVLASYLKMTPEEQEAFRLSVEEMAEFEEDE